MQVKTGFLGRPGNRKVENSNSLLKATKKTISTCTGRLVGDALKWRQASGQAFRFFDRDVLEAFERIRGDLQVSSSASRDMFLGDNDRPRLQRSIWANTNMVAVIVNAASVGKSEGTRAIPFHLDACYPTYRVSSLPRCLAYTL